MSNVLDPVLISGASKGIGKACAHALASRGCQSLIITGRSISTLNAAKQDIKDKNPTCNVCVYVCNHENDEDIAALIHKLNEKKQIPQTIIANVGDNPVHRLGPKKMSSTTTEVINKTFNTNVTNTHALISPFLRHYQRNGGRIILVGSQAYQLGVPGQLAYNVSKAALLGYKNTLVSEYGNKNVFCHLINPGLVENQRTQKLREKLGELDTVTEQEVAEIICNTLMQEDKNGLEINI